MAQIIQKFDRKIAESPTLTHVNRYWLSVGIFLSIITIIYLVDTNPSADGTSQSVSTSGVQR